MIEDQEPTKITISGHTIEVGENRSVFVGTSEEEDGVFINFTNGDRKTKIRISAEAAKALCELLRDVQDGTPLMAMWVMHHYGKTADDEPSDCAKAT